MRTSNARAKTYRLDRGTPNGDLGVVALAGFALAILVRRRAKRVARSPR